MAIFEQFANDLTSDTSRGRGDTNTRKQHVRELINFFPVYGEDDNGEMIPLDEEKVLSIPRRIHAVEVVRRGFMSNFLFQNIGNIFNAPAAAIEIIKKFEPAKEPPAINPTTKQDLSLNDNGEVEVSEEMIIGTANDIFGPKMYTGITDTLIDKVEEIQAATEKPQNILTEVREAFVTSVIKPLVATAGEHYGNDLTPTNKRAIERRIAAEANSTLEKAIGNYTIQTNEIENERKIAIKEAEKAHKSEADIAAINKDYDAKKDAAEQVFKEDIKEKAKKVVEESGKIIVNTVETDTREKEKEKNAIENKVRDHLRGFSRTIPSFLMAYGTENTTLATFDKIIPDNVFQEVTSITLDEFRFLRDGGDYKDEETGETKHFDGHLFDQVVFDDSVKEFLALKERLANYFDESSKEDIFDYIPPQKTNQIFTPKKVVVEMVDNLEKECPDCFDDPSKTFIDLYVKSGLYITEIVKRLYRSKAMKKLYPDDKERLANIFAKQVYGLAPTEIIYRIASAYILGFDKDVKIKEHNLRQFDTLPPAQKGNLKEELDKLFPGDG